MAPFGEGGEVKREEEEAHREAGERVERRSRDDEGILDEQEPVVVTVLCESGRAQTDRGVSRRSAYVELVAPRWGVSCHRASGVVQSIGGRPPPSSRLTTV